MEIVENIRGSREVSQADNLPPSLEGSPTPEEALDELVTGIMTDPVDGTASNISWHEREDDLSRHSDDVDSGTGDRDAMEMMEADNASTDDEDSRAAAEGSGEVYDGDDYSSKDEVETIERDGVDPDARDGTETTTNAGEGGVLKAGLSSQTASSVASTESLPQKSESRPGTAQEVGQCTFFLQVAAHKWFTLLVSPNVWGYLVNSIVPQKVFWSACVNILLSWRRASNW